MSVYLHATIEAKASELGRLLATLGEMKRILAAAGWGMVGCFTHRTGRLNTVLDIWELDDMNHYERGLQVLAAHVRFPAIAEVLGAAVLRETLVFSQRVDLDALAPKEG